MVFIDAVAAVGLYIISLFKVAGLAIFVAPFTDLSMLGALIPAWIGWLFTEYFREGEHSTSKAGLVGGGFVALWAGINWMIKTIGFLHAGTYRIVGSGFWGYASEFWGYAFLSFAVIAFGLFIMIQGFRSKKMPLYINRVWFFIVIMFTPLYYRVMYISWAHVIATIALMPVFYWIVQSINIIRFRVIARKKGKEEKIK